VKIGSPEQSALSGPNSSKVIVPVGSKPPDSVAVSEMSPPTVTVAEA
jgi:hypothetical protein